jgi:hypothetical protein
MGPAPPLMYSASKVMLSACRPWLMLSSKPVLRVHSVTLPWACGVLGRSHHQRLGAEEDRSPPCKRHPQDREVSFSSSSFRSYQLLNAFCS